MDHGGSGRRLPPERAGNETKVGRHAEAAGGASKNEFLFFKNKNAFHWNGVTLNSKTHTIIRLSLFLFDFISFCEVVFCGNAGYSTCVRRSFV